MRKLLGRIHQDDLKKSPTTTEGPGHLSVSQRLRSGDRRKINDTIYTLYWTILLIFPWLHLSLGLLPTSLSDKSLWVCMIPPVVSTSSHQIQKNAVQHRVGPSFLRRYQGSTLNKGQKEASGDFVNQFLKKVSFSILFLLFQKHLGRAWRQNCFLKVILPKHCFNSNKCRHTSVYGMALQNGYHY